MLFNLHLVWSCTTHALFRCQVLALLVFELKYSGTPNSMPLLLESGLFCCQVIHIHCIDSVRWKGSHKEGFQLPAQSHGWEKVGNTNIFFSCHQAALWMVFSVRLSVCPSVCPSVRLSICPSVTPFWLCSHHRIIMKFSGVITLDQGKVHAKGQGQRSKVKVREVTTQIFVSGL